MDAVPRFWPGRERWSARVRGRLAGSSEAKRTAAAGPWLVQDLDSRDGGAGEPGRRPGSPGRAVLTYIDTSLLVPYYCPETSLPTSRLTADSSLLYQ